MQIASARTRNLLAISTLFAALSLLLVAVPGQAGAKTLTSKANQANKAAKAACKASKTKTAKGKRDCAKAKNRAKALGRQLAQARKNRFFNVCDLGCPSRTIQEGADAAGAFQKRTGVKATVRVKPGTYSRSEAFLDGRNPSYDYDGLTIMGVKANLTPAASRAQAEQVVLDGEGAADVAIQARSVNKLRLLNMYAKNYTGTAANERVPRLLPFPLYTVASVAAGDGRRTGRAGAGCGARWGGGRQRRGERRGRKRSHGRDASPPTPQSADSGLGSLPQNAGLPNPHARPQPRPAPCTRHLR
jgi:hypothetical protein